MKYLYTTLGFVFFGLGAVGAILPILPTTPFLLLASVCFAKGSVRFNKWFCQTALYKKYLEEFVKTRSMAAKTKAVLLISVTTMIMIPFVLVDNVYMRITLGAIILAKYYYFIFRVKTLPKSKKAK